MNTPKVSIGMPIRNEEKRIRNALDSLLAQTFRDFELIISDNASTDGSQEICMEYAKRDARIQYSRNETNLGMTRNQNRVFELARGEFFMWASGNKGCYPEFIQKCLNVMEQDANIAVCYPMVHYTDDTGTPVLDRYPCRLDTRGLNVSARASLVIWGMNSCEALYGLYRSSALKQTKLFRNVICPDNLVLFEVSLAGSMAHIPEPLLFMSGRPEDRWPLGRIIEIYQKKFYPDDKKYFRLWLTNWRLVYEHLAAVLRAPVRFNRKPVLLFVTLFGLLAKRGKHMLHDLIELIGFRRP